MPKKTTRRVTVVAAAIPATINETFGLVPGGVESREVAVLGTEAWFAAYALMKLPGQTVAPYEPTETDIIMRVTRPDGETWLVDDKDDFQETFLHTDPPAGTWTVQVTNIGSKSVTVELLAGAG